MNKLNCADMKHLKNGRCNGVVTHLDSKGWAYCAECAKVRSHSMRVYKLTSDQLSKLIRGETLKRSELRG